MATLLSEVAQALGAALTLTNLFGAVGVACSLTWGLLPTRRAILACQAAGSCCWALHYSLLGSPAGAFVCLVAVAQSVAVSRKERPAWIVPFFAVSLLMIFGVAAATWHGVPSLCAATGALFGAAGRLQRDPQRMRLVFLGSSASWITHDALFGSAVALVADALSLSSILTGLYRNRRTARPAAGRPHLAVVEGRRPANAAGDGDRRLAA